MTRTKNRLFKTLVTVTMLFIMAFTVAGNVFAESKAAEGSTVGVVDVDYTETTVTVRANCSCNVKITIMVKDGQQNSTLTALFSLINETKELTINDFVTNYYSDEAVITNLLSISVIDATKTINDNFFTSGNFVVLVICVAAVLIILICAIYAIVTQ